MLCKGVKRNFLFGERLEGIRDRSIYRLLYAFWKLKNSPTAARHRAVVARIFWKMGMVIGDYLEEYLRNNATSLSLKPISSGIPCPITFHGGRK